MAEHHQSVHELSMAGIVPPDFMRMKQDQSGAAMFPDTGPHAPVIDMTKPDCRACMSDAAMEWGCFQVVNHGVPAALLAELQRVGRAFFELTPEEKCRYSPDPASGSVEGYKVGTMVQRNLTGKKMWRDFFYHYVAPPSIVNHNIWPQNPASYREANEEYCQHMQRFMGEMFEHLSVGLGLEKGAMREAFGGDDDLVLLQKINSYPPCPRPDLVLGIGPHTDACTLTILLPNEVPGLQIIKDGCWHDVEYIPGALIILIGDQIEASAQLLITQACHIILYIVKFNLFARHGYRYSAMGGTKPECTVPWSTSRRHV
ncbi:hypothetical protein PR202_gb13507 [Eleusine coracana subsp. coracana]|uniref:Fe2OG dioxygenase domain-containing protein n=1 Tax=Eleusine coracana subsp. coracana TaxID=191504 RepID=A0AAV5ES79_ELECO|nr:hypothetical protein PR202_gb13507 [Eleusine coracana subsp. coracana]